MAHEFHSQLWGPFPVPGWLEGKDAQEEIDIPRNLVNAGFVPGPNQERAGVDPLAAAAALEAECVESRHDPQQLLHSPDDLEQALDGFLGLIGVEVEELRAAGDHLADERAVFHRARAQRVGDQTRAETHLREP